MLRTCLILLAMLPACAYVAAQAQTYPVRPIRMIVGFAPGGGTDTLARIAAKRLNESLGQQVVIDNRPGADGAIATEIAAKSDADGYTLVMVSNAHTITPHLRRLGYDPVKSFVAVTLVGSTPNLLLVHPSVAAASVKELVALAKSKPGQLSFASSGAGTSPFLAMELFKAMANVDMVHVPYKGSSPAVIDLIGGHVQLMFGAIPTTLPHVRSGKLRALAVSSPKRAAAVPELPTVAESGLAGFEAQTWYGLLAPAGTPRRIVDRVQAEVAAALKSREVGEYLFTIGVDAIGSGPDEFAAIIRDDLVKWGKVLRAAGVKPAA